MWNVKQFIRLFSYPGIVYEIWECKIEYKLKKLDTLQWRYMDEALEMGRDEYLKLFPSSRSRNNTAGSLAVSSLMITKRVTWDAPAVKLVG